MRTRTETFSTRRLGDPRPSTGHGEAEAECDLCGRPARRETAFQRIYRGDDGIEIVPVCRECELGTD